MVENQLSYLLRVGFYLGWFYTLKMEVISTSETLVYLRTNRSYSPENGNILVSAIFVNILLNFGGGEVQRNCGAHIEAWREGLMVAMFSGVV
jgi:hypothetical protein